MNILLNAAHKIDTTSFYRAHGVFGKLSREIPNLQLHDFSNKPFSWADLSMIDAAFFQRPYSQKHMVAIQYIKEMKIPLWIDFDDNVFEIPIDNKAFNMYNAPGVRENIGRMISMADVLTVSTEELKKVFTPLNKNIHVVPNAINDYLFDCENVQASTTNVVGWRGSETHLVDLLGYANEISSAINTHTKLEFNFMGYLPWFIHTATNGKIINHPVTDPMVYFRKLKKLAPKYFHVPLIHNRLNFSKSNIAILESVWAGAVCLVPDWGEWDIPGAIRYKTVKEFGILLDGLCKGEINHAEKHAQSWEYIRENFLLSKVNKLRAKILKSLI